jgi:hypothetical protein
VARQKQTIRGTKMNTERYVRMAAGAFVVVSLALGHWVHPAWLLFTAFVGVNLFQSSFTSFCPLESILRRAGVPSSACGCGGGGR